MQFSNEWFNGYLSTVHKHILHEAPRYDNFFIQDYWTYLHGNDIIGRLWRESVKPEDPVDVYKRITGTSQSEFNDEMWDCAARFATWDIPTLKLYGASKILSRPQPKMNSMGDDFWMIDPSICPENYGHNIIRLNVPISAKTVTAHFEGKAGYDGFRKNYMSYAGWRFGFVALKNDGTRVYGEIKSADITTNDGKVSVKFDCPEDCSRLWLVVTGAPRVHWRHAWDDDDTNDEQWPYQVKFENTNRLGYANVITSSTNIHKENVVIYSSDSQLLVDNCALGSTIRIYNLSGICLLNEDVLDSSFSTSLVEGVYIILIQNSTGMISRKICVIK